MKVGRVNSCSVSGSNRRPDAKSKGKDIRQKLNLIFYNTDGVESSCMIPTEELGMMRVCIDLSSAVTFTKVFTNALE
jgi:hypothetical protein